MLGSRDADGFLKVEVMGSWWFYMIIAGAVSGMLVMYSCCA